LEIASNAPADQSERYLAAANEFRVPYWDWAQGTKTGPFPAFLTTETISVIDTDGTQAEIHNPLYSYKFKTIPDNFDKKVSDPSVSESAYANEQNSGATSTKQSAGRLATTHGQHPNHG
jgi:hypothetical protein